MSLKQLALDPYILAQILSRPIIPEQTGSPVRQQADSPTGVLRTLGGEEGLPVQYLGENQQNILLLLYDEQTAFLPEGLFNFLTTILSACKLTMADIAIVNTAHYPGTGLPGFRKQFKPRACILFGDALPDLSAEKDNRYAVRLEDGCKLLLADGLQQISEDKGLKGKLWASLQKLFNLAG